MWCASVCVHTLTDTVDAVSAAAKFTATPKTLLAFDVPKKQLVKSKCQLLERTFAALLKGKWRG